MSVAAGAWLHIICFTFIFIHLFIQQAAGEDGHRVEIMKENRRRQGGEKSEEWERGEEEKDEENDEDR